MIILKKDDYKTNFIFECKSNDTLIPLIGSKVMFEFISKSTGSKVGGGECLILDSERGLVKYDFKEPELFILGEYQGRVTIELAQGSKRESITIEFKIIE